MTLEREAIDDRKRVFPQFGRKRRTERPSKFLSREAIGIVARLRTVHRPAMTPQWASDTSNSGARPVPFWRQSFFPLPLTTPRVLVAAVPLRFESS